ncbi:hypothetical protein HYX00_04795 [Candidatus Woesearchaeota archaeon]|nr:hypothetical protein [Candidatus Woesearchaeota archaeon]
MDNKLLKILEQGVAKEKAKKKKKQIFNVRKEKSVMYYSGWGKGKPIKEEKTERQAKLIS